MRKRIIRQQSVEPAGDEWLDLERLAEVEVTSEDPQHPIEAALLPEGVGWRASAPGTQTIRLLFERSQRLRRIQVLFTESIRARAQEFALSWSGGDGEPMREIVRQQYNFSPPETVQELEDYRVELASVRTLELTIIPDRSGGSVFASLARLRVA